MKNKNENKNGNVKLANKYACRPAYLKPAITREVYRNQEKKNTKKRAPKWHTILLSNDYKSARLPSHTTDGKKYRQILLTMISLTFHDFIRL